MEVSNILINNNFSGKFNEIFISNKLQNQTNISSIVDETSSQGFFLDSIWEMDWLQVYDSEVIESIDLDPMTGETVGELSDPIISAKEPVSLIGKLQDVNVFGTFIDE